MNSRSPLRAVLAGLVAMSLLTAQVPQPQPPQPQLPKPVVPPGFGPQVGAVPVFDPNQRPPGTPVQQEPTSATFDPAPPQAAGQGVTAAAAQALGGGGGSVGSLTLQNVSLREVVDLLARQLKINYIIDPRVNGSVVLNTYGETKNLDMRSLLDTILRINNAAMVQVGEIYRIVPLSEVSRLPMKPEVSPEEIANDDQVMLNLVFLKYTTVEELAKVLGEFIGENAKMYTYPPANLLFMLDSRRNIRRTMELIQLFDNDQFANQRVRLFEVSHGKPSDLAKELDGILKSISLSEKSGTVKFLPVDRINLLIGVAPNPGVFDQVETWLKKLDVPVKVTAGTVDNYVYRVKYGRAECIAMALMMVYGQGYGMGMGMGMMGGMGMGGMYGGYAGGMGGYGGGMGMGGFGGGGGGGGFGQGLNGLGAAGAGGCGGMGGGMGFGGGGYGMGMGMGMGGYGMGMGGGYGMPGYGYPGAMPQYASTPFGAGAAASGTATTQGAGTQGQTGSYQGASGSAPEMAPRGPRIVPNPLDNTLIIQGTPQEWVSVQKLLRELDIPPRQILLEARIYEVSLTGAFASGLSVFFQNRNNPIATGKGGLGGRTFVGSAAEGITDLTAGMLVGKARELLAFLQLQENSTKAKVVSAPSLIATDSIPASINVGSEVPTLSAQAATGIQTQGTSNFAQSISGRNTGVTLNVMARVNPSGIVTLIINQEVSTPVPPPAGAIPTPSFDRRSVQTQITMQDGDTIAIGGIIDEKNASSSAGIPGLHRLPVVGALFGSRGYTKERTELIVFMTPRVIFDNTDLLDASEELKSRLKRLRRYVREL